MITPTEPVPLRAMLTVREFIETEGTPLALGSVFSDEYQTLLNAAKALAAAALDGRSCSRRVEIVRKALEILEC